MTVKTINPRRVVRNEIDTEWLETETLGVGSVTVDITKSSETTLVQVINANEQYVKEFKTFADARAWGLKLARGLMFVNKCFEE